MKNPKMTKAILPDYADMRAYVLVKGEDGKRSCRIVLVGPQRQAVEARFHHKVRNLGNMLTTMIREEVNVLENDQS